MIILIFFIIFYLIIKIKSSAFQHCLIRQWWLKPGSNWRHKDFQSFALPTELSSQMAVLTGIEPAIFSVTGRHVNRYTTRPFGCGNRIWTYDLRVMSPTSYRTALSRDVKNGGETGIRTPATCYSTAGFQDQSLQPLGYFSKIYISKSWWTL